MPYPKQLWQKSPKLWRMAWWCCGWKMCQREDEIKNLKSSVEVLHNELKAARHAETLLPDHHGIDGTRRSGQHPPSINMSCQHLGLPVNEGVQTRSPGLSSKASQRAAMHITGPILVTVPLHITSNLALGVLQGGGSDRIILRGRDKDGGEKVEDMKGDKHRSAPEHGNDGVFDASHILNSTEVEEDDHELSGYVQDNFDFLEK